MMASPDAAPLGKSAVVQINLGWALTTPGVNAEAWKVGSGHGVDAAGINSATGRRQTGQGRDNIVPYLFS